MCKINLNQTAILSINHADLGNGFTETVSATELHQFLGVKDRFDQWVKRRIEMLGLEQNQDFITDKVVRKGLVSRSYTEYYLTLEAAKHISMAERNHKGRQARQYFIQVEDKAQQVIPNLQQKLSQQRTQLATLSDALLDSNPMWDKIVRYSQVGLAQWEIAKLCDITTETLRAHQRKLSDYGIIDSPSKGLTASKNFTQQQLQDMALARKKG